MPSCLLTSTNKVLAELPERVGCNGFRESLAGPPSHALPKFVSPETVVFPPHTTKAVFGGMG